MTCQAPATMDADHVSRMDHDSFLARFAGVFESSPWVAREAWRTRPWATVAELHAAMVGVVAAAPRERRLELLRAHPDLAGVDGRNPDLTRASASEQAAAGLDDLDVVRGRRLAALTREYRRRFGFPFIVCAREHTPASILAHADARLGSAPEEEERAALTEVAKIARLRLADLVTDPEAAR